MSLRKEELVKEWQQSYLLSVDNSNHFWIQHHLAEQTSGFMVRLTATLMGTLTLCAVLGVQAAVSGKTCRRHREIDGSQGRP